jgi:hypothetical protein
MSIAPERWWFSGVSPTKQLHLTSNMVSDIINRKSIVAIDGPRVRFPADAVFFVCLLWYVLSVYSYLTDFHFGVSPIKRRKGRKSV